MTLRELQLAFRDHLLRARDEIRAYTGDDAEPGLAVYHHAYRAQLIACLGDTYEKVWAWLGDDGFEAAGLRHIDTYPPHGWTLNDYGGEFPDILADLYPDDPEVAELGRLDWALRRAFDGADAAAINIADLAEVDWETAILRFSPTLRVFTVVTNAAAIWSAIAAEDRPPPVARLPSAAAIRVWRSGLSPRFRTMDDVERRALSMARGGASFSQLCGELGQWADEAQAAALAGQCLADWLKDGLVTAITTSGPRP